MPVFQRMANIVYTETLNKLKRHFKVDLFSFFYLDNVF